MKRANVPTTAYICEHHMSILKMTEGNWLETLLVCFSLMASPIWIVEVALPLMIWACVQSLHRCSINCHFSSNKWSTIDMAVVLGGTYFIRCHCLEAVHVTPFLPVASVEDHCPIIQKYWFATMVKDARIGIFKRTPKDADTQDSPKKRGTEEAYTLVAAD